jgi:predicted transposase YbfD/YdcC
MSPTGTIANHFSSVKDPRAEYRIEHKLMDILIITICATICGANDWEAVAEYGRAKSLIHMVSVWSSEHRLVLGQQKVDEKSNEITAIPKLLELLMIQGCLVSMDAMGCQKHIAQTIIAQGADYVLALKGNQGDLHQDVVQLFAAASKCNFQGIEHQFHSTTNRGHGRLKINCIGCWMLVLKRIRFALVLVIVQRISLSFVRWA